MSKLYYIFRIWLPEHTLCKWYGHRWVGVPETAGCERCGLDRQSFIAAKVRPLLPMLDDYIRDLLQGDKHD